MDVKQVGMITLVFGLFVLAVVAMRIAWVDRARSAMIGIIFLGLMAVSLTGLTSYEPWIFGTPLLLACAVFSRRKSGPPVLVE